MAAIAPMTREDQVVGFITIGPRRNDLEFSAEALAFLTTAASSATLALRRPHASPPRLARASRDEPLDEPAAECEACGTVLAADAVRCSCGGRLRAAALPHVLAGKFQVESRLGAGGMGVVYRATDLSLGRPVALKTLPRLTRSAVDRLRAEAQSMARAGQGSLATIHAIETWQRAPVLVIELLDGGTLADRLRRGRMAPPDAVPVAIQLAGSLAHLHREGLLHRDVKPGNIGFTGSGQLKLLDFGLAAALQEPAAFADHADTPDRETTRTVAGTPLYLPPEAWDDGRPGPAWDLWAAAIVLAEMLLGHHPLARERSLRDALVQLRAGRVASAVSLAEDVPETLARFVEAALATRPEGRPASAEAFVRDLAASLPEDPSVRRQVLVLRNAGFDV